MERPRPSTKDIARVGFAFLTLISVTACHSKGEVNAGAAEAGKNIPATPTPVNKEQGISVKGEVFTINRLSGPNKEGARSYLVTADSVYRNWRQNALGRGIRHMINRGCEIIDIRSVDSGEIVTVANDSECFPKLK